MLYSKLDGPALVKRLKGSPEISWKVDGTEVLMANGQSAGIPKVFRDLAWDFLDEISKLTEMCCLHIMVNRQPAGNVIPRHTDTVKGHPFRYHLPLITNLDVAFWNEKDHWYWMGCNVWHPFDYSIPHAVVNFGKEERIHLIVDLIPF